MAHEKCLPEYFYENLLLDCYLLYPLFILIFPLNSLVSIVDTIPFLFRVSVNEQSALRDLRERFFYHREELISIFKKYDSAGNGNLFIFQSC